MLDSEVYPVAVAAHSNLSVGYGINSACAVVAVMGNRAAVNWDCAGLKNHPFYKYSDQKIIFSSLDDLEEAILKASQGDATIGDYSRWKKHVNHFEDSFAVHRIANFLESYMTESTTSSDPEHSLDFAVKKYISDNKVNTDFFQREDIWEDE